MDKLIGVCSLCGGSVAVPEPWYSVEPPIPTCKRCGAKAKPAGPVIDMEPKQESAEELVEKRVLLKGQPIGNGVYRVEKPTTKGKPR
jgi:hypothetical protein